MRISDKAILLQTIKHGDKKYILKLYTLNHGFIIASAIAGATPKSKIKFSALLPLNLLDVELVVKQNNDVQQLNEVSCYYVTTTINTSLNKLSIALFLNEVLIKSLKEQAPNAHLYSFIETCIKFLNTSESNFINLHLYFLIKLTKYLGIEPKNNFDKNFCFFDCREGQFTSYSLSFPLGLNAEESVLLSVFLKTNNLNITINHAQRQQLLNVLLVYYSFHIPNFKNLKSLAVLQEIVMV
jgi:DNA repair protein RecO (recombination protein O)